MRLTPLQSVAEMFARVRGKCCFNRGYAVAFAILFNTFSSYFIGQVIVSKIAGAFVGSSFEVLLNLVYPSSIVASALVGSVLFVDVRRRRFLCLWLVLGISSSLLLALSYNSSLSLILVSTGLLGASLGLGMPMCLGLFVKSVLIEDRGKMGGIILFATTFSAPLVITVVPRADLMTSAVLLAMWRAWSLPLVILVSAKDSAFERSTKRTPSLFSILQNRTFYLYFFAWLMFAFINGFEAVVVEHNISTDAHWLLMVVEPTISGFSALIGGIVSDWVGRKPVLVFGFVSFGIAYSILALGALDVNLLWLLWPVFFLIDGLGLGLLWVMFTLVLWGEIDSHNPEKCYAVGESPLFLTQIVSLLLAPYVQMIPMVSAFSLAAFFLFVAVIPLLYARETLPQNKVEERQLRIYTEEALELRQKTEHKQA